MRQCRIPDVKYFRDKEDITMPAKRRFRHINVICGCSVHMCGREGEKKRAIGTEQRNHKWGS
jgi:hypothetical protein